MSIFSSPKSIPHVNIWVLTGTNEARNYQILSTQFMTRKTQEATQNFLSLIRTLCPNQSKFIKSKSKLHTSRWKWLHRARQLSRLLGASTTVTLCWLNTASCSWYAWNSHRLKQTQAWNKQPCSSFPVHPAPATSSVNPYHSAATEEGITRLSLLLNLTTLLLKLHSPQINSTLPIFTFSSSLLLSAGSFRAHNVTVLRSGWATELLFLLTQCTLSQSSLHKGKKTSTIGVN